MATPELNLNERRQATSRNRFGWVRRLMQGQNRTTNSDPSHPHHQRHDGVNHGANHRPSQNKQKQKQDARKKLQNSNTNNSHSSSENYSVDNESDQITTNSELDNVSTTPLKSIVSTQSTKSPSILSGEVNIDTSTAETSLAPSLHTSHNNNHLVQPQHHQNVTIQSPNERDSESIVTLASSSRRIRRRSIDTNCSTAGIPPASIMERLGVQQTTANSLYAPSIRTTNDRISQYDRFSQNDRFSQGDNLQSDDQSSSMKSLN